MHQLVPYFIAFTLCLTGSSIWFPNCETVILALSAVEIVKPFVFFGIMIDLSKYQAGSPFFLGLSGAVGSAIGSCLFYYMGRGARKLSPKISGKLDNFNFDRFKKSSVLVMYTSASFSIPPYTPVAVAAGVIRYPFWKYVSVSFAGKLTRFLIVAYMGGAFVRLIVEFFMNLF